MQIEQNSSKKVIKIGANCAIKWWIRHQSFFPLIPLQLSGWLLKQLRVFPGILNSLHLHCLVLLCHNMKTMLQSYSFQHIHVVIQKMAVTVDRKRTYAVKLEVSLTCIIRLSYIGEGRGRSQKYSCYQVLLLKNLIPSVILQQSINKPSSIWSNITNGMCTAKRWLQTCGLSMYKQIYWLVGSVSDELYKHLFFHRQLNRSTWLFW